MVVCGDGAVIVVCECNRPAADLHVVHIPSHTHKLTAASMPAQKDKKNAPS